MAKGDSDPVAVSAYASFAERYDALAPIKPHNALYERPASLELLGDVKGLNILDAGCGSGICSEKLARSGARVSAFDITPEMLALARQRCAGLNVDMRLGNLERALDWLADGSFDRILCSLALDYVEKLGPVFAEFHRVSCPGGWLVFSMSHPMRDWQDTRTRGTKPILKRIAGACIGEVLANQIPMLNPIVDRSAISSMALPIRAGRSTASSNHFPRLRWKWSTPGILPN
ncbi:class I SAM-dependent methyltransferase [Mesorhizobium sp. M0166]|uniref:class I SAM-dependent methyltransferase n=1 Tax=Mesorhizobium sp. M0166 TaxID=2956902 RepID=UPI00333B7468